MINAQPPSPNTPAPDAAATVRTATAGTRKRVRFWRWVLTPRTTLQARRLAADFGPGMDADMAWVLARLQRHPEERAYVPHHLGGDTVDGTPAGAHSKIWE